MDLEPRLLRYLLALGEAGSFVRAAERLGISQPSLSVAIARLEDVAGMRLVERGRHGARLNAAGTALARHATSIENVLAAAAGEAVLMQSGVAGPLSIGGTPLATASIIPEAVAVLSRAAQAPSMRIVEGPDEELIALLERHRLDVVISNIGLAPQPPGIESTPLFRARTVAVVRPGHRLAAHRRLSLHDLGRHPLALPPPGGTFRHSVEALLATHGLALPVGLIEADRFETLKLIVKNSDAVTLLSDQIVRPELRDGSLIALEIAESAAPRRFGLHVLRGRPLGTLAEDFIAAVTSLAPGFDIPA